MTDLSNIFNENYGYCVASHGDYVAIGNPPSSDYNPKEGLGRIGEVFLVKKSTFTNNYEVVQTYTKKQSSYWLESHPYATESGSAGDTGITSSINYESGSRGNNDYTCSLISLEDSEFRIYQSRFGKAIDISTYDVAITDTAFSESYQGELSYSVELATVDVYALAERSGSATCVTSSNDTFVISDVPRCVVTGSSVDEFGTSVSISTNYLVIGAPNYTNGSGSVHIYKHSDLCGFTFIAELSSSAQDRFGYSVAIDKKDETNIIVGTDSSTSNNVYVYKNSGNDVWVLSQTLVRDTSAALFNLTNVDMDFIPISQSDDRYGYSVDIYDTLAVVGAPNDLIYYEFSGSTKIRQRGSTYVYSTDTGCLTSSADFQLFEKLYGDETTFKDNLFGYSVAVYDKKVLIGSPKPYFPFSTLYLSESVSRAVVDFNVNDFGQSSYNGQTLLYEFIDYTSSMSVMTSDPIAYRKRENESFSAFGHSVAISNHNVVVGSPTILNDDQHLAAPFLLEESGSSPTGCTTASVMVTGFEVEDALTCGSGSIIFVQEQETMDEISGHAFVYDFSDLRTDHAVGSVFYNNNRVIVNNTGSIMKDLLRDPENLEDEFVYMDYKSQLTLHETQYICTIEPGEFNISTNRSALVVGTFEYAIANKEKFDFDNLDLILRFINYKITTDNSEAWWDSFIEGEVETSIFDYFKSNLHDYTANRLTDELLCDIIKKDLDVNSDGRVDILDGSLIWKHFIESLSTANVETYVSFNSKRTSFDEIVRFLNEKTGKATGDTIDPTFFDYSHSSSLDVTGSYLAPYITTVGLYSGGDLVSIAKLAHPIKNTGEIPINFVVKWYN
jgi:hypothetical protein